MAPLLAFGFLCIASLALVYTLGIPVRLYFERRRLGLPWRFLKLTEVGTETPFPRTLFRMRGFTGGPIPLKAPLSGKECYSYEVLFYPREGTRAGASSISVMDASREFTFYSPKGPVNLDPKEISKESRVAMRVEHAFHLPLPREIKEKLQKLGQGKDGALEERIIPAFQQIQLIGCAEVKNPTTWRMKEGPGVFPLIAASDEAVESVSPAGALQMTSKKVGKMAAALFVSVCGYYFFWQLLHSPF